MSNVQNQPDEAVLADDFSADNESQETPTKTSNLKGLWANQKSRKVLIVTTAVVLLALGFVVMKISSASRHQEAADVSVAGKSKVASPPADVREGGSPILEGNEQYNKMVAETVAAQASAALASGDSSMPTTATLQVTTTGDQAPNPSPNSGSGSGSAMPSMRADMAGAGSGGQQGASITNPAYTQQQQPSEQQATQQPSPAEQAEQARLQAIQAEAYAKANEAVAGLVTQRRNSLQIVTVSKADPTADANANPQSGASPSRGQAPQTQSGSEQGVTLVSAGEIEAARLDIAVNTDVSTEWVGTLLTGRYAGAKVIGSVERRGVLAHMVVNTLSFPAQRQSVAASAVAIDANTYEAGNATDVDRKLFVRYGVKPLAAGFAAVAQYLQSAGTTVVVNGSAVSQTVPGLTSKRAGQLVAGSAAQQIANDTTAMDTTPTVRVARGTVIGIFFLKPVVYTGTQNRT